MEHSRNVSGATSSTGIAPIRTSKAPSDILERQVACVSLTRTLCWEYELMPIHWLPDHYRTPRTTTPGPHVEISPSIENLPCNITPEVSDRPLDSDGPQDPAREPRDIKLTLVRDRKRATCLHNLRGNLKPKTRDPGSRLHQMALQASPRAAR